MQNIVKKILETALFEKKALKTKDLEVDDHEYAGTKYVSFVTFYDEENQVVGSSGRVHPQKSNTFDELIDNTLEAVKDKRFERFRDNPELARKLKIRVDIVEENGRKLVEDPNKTNAKEEGMIVVCQAQGKLGVILPGMVENVKNGQDLFDHVCAKAGIDTKKLQKGDAIVYAIRTERFED